jgi:hypothetical protein
MKSWTFFPASAMANPRSRIELSSSLIVRPRPTCTVKEARAAKKIPPARGSFSRDGRGAASRTYWSVGTMPEGCWDRSTGWLPSAAIDTPNKIPPPHSRSAAPAGSRSEGSDSGAAGNPREEFEILGLL